MTGRERSRVLAVRCADPVLSVLAPVGLAAASGTALLVDLADEIGGVGRTLADIARDGPRLDEVSPGRAGIAVLRSGPIALDEATSVVERLASRWPAVVVRVGWQDWPGPIVPVRVLYPGWLAPVTREPSVWQRLPSSPKPPGPGPVLPPLRPGLVRRVLAGRLPGLGRWGRAWGQVWELPWA